MAPLLLRRRPFTPQWPGLPQRRWPLKLAYPFHAGPPLAVRLRPPPFLLVGSQVAEMALSKLLGWSS